jgi:hypothetical protein
MLANRENERLGNLFNEYLMKRQSKFLNPQPEKHVFKIAGKPQRENPILKPFFFPIKVC